ncbi:MAG: hypothetical protein AABX39_06175 [Nanoarchaeota archaeon]
MSLELEVSKTEFDVPKSEIAEMDIRLRIQKIFENYWKNRPIQYIKENYT